MAFIMAVASDVIVSEGSGEALGVLNSSEVFVIMDKLLHLPEHLVTGAGEGIGVHF